MTTYLISSGFALSGSTLFSGTTSSTVNLQSGDIVSVLTGGTIENIELAGETVFVSRGGSAFAVSVGSGAVLSAIASAVLNGDVIESGGTVWEGGTTNNNTNMVILSGGLLDIGPATGSQALPVYVYSGAEVEFGGVAATGALSTSNTASTTIITVSATGLAHQQVVITGSGITFTSTSTGGVNNRSIFTFTSQSPGPQPCYAEGTLIDTPEGPRAIEDFQEGDLVTVQRGGQRVAEAVRWIGRSRIDLSRHARPENAAPVRVKAGALADNVPSRDLVVSPEHCLILNGKCVPVKLLINGGSIVRDFPAEPFSYYHLELDRHGILLAEGAEAESYLDTGNRTMFDNADGPRVLHPDFDLPTAERWTKDACAPLADVPGDVAPIWQALAERSSALGFEVPTPALVANPDVHLIVDGKRVQPASERNGRYVFMVPAGARSVTLGSRFCIPADKMIPGLRDTRRLGVRVDQMSIRTMTDETVLPADHPALAQGWNEVEQDDATMWRWTDGAGVIPWDNVEGSAVLTIRCKPVAEYPVYDEKLRLVA